MCIFILQTMSAEQTFGKSLNNKFEAQETLPQSIRLLKFRGSYADFLIMVGLSLIRAKYQKLTAAVHSYPDNDEQRQSGHCLPCPADHS
jgi:hypothetical protein